MPRTRQVKHGLWLNEELLEAQEVSGLGAVVTLTFIGLMACADREGRFRWKPRRLQAQIDPLRSYDFRACLEALVKSGHVVRYEVDGETYGVLPNFTKHQSIHKNEAASNIPADGSSITRNDAEPPVGSPNTQGECGANVASGVSGVSGVSDIPPNPPGGAEGSAARGGEGSKAEPGGIPDDCLDAWDANRSGRMLEARRPPDPGTVKRWERLGRPGADEIADRVRRAGSSPRYANPDRADPLTFGALMSRSTWAAVGELEVTPTARAPDMAAAQARTALGAAEHLWGLGDHETARKVLGRALDHPATAEEAAHIRDLWEREKEGVA